MATYPVLHAITLFVYDITLSLPQYGFSIEYEAAAANMAANVGWYIPVFYLHLS